MLKLPELQPLQSIEAGPSTEAAEGRCFAVVTMLHLGGREWIGGFGVVNGLNKIRHVFRMFLLSMFGPGFDVLAQHPNIRLATEAKCPMAR